MGWLDRLRNLLAGSGTRAEGQDAEAVRVYVRCGRCGEPIALRLSKRNEIQRNYDDEGADYVHFVNKLVVGTRCFQRMEIRLEFDAGYRIVRRELKGGTWLTPEEYRAATDADSGTP